MTSRSRLARLALAAALMPAATPPMTIMRWLMMLASKGLTACRALVSVSFWLLEIGESVSSSPLMQDCFALAGQVQGGSNSPLHPQLAVCLAGLFLGLRNELDAGALECLLCLGGDQHLAVGTLSDDEDIWTGLQR